jgi:hypothetical protein
MTGQAFRDALRDALFFQEVLAEVLLGADVHGLSMIQRAVTPSNAGGMGRRAQSDPGVEAVHVVEGPSTVLGVTVMINSKIDIRDRSRRMHHLQ